MAGCKAEKTNIDWKAKWIWKDTGITVNDFAYFRKEYNLKSPAAGARVYVSAHNHFELYINGIRVGGYVVPAPTHPVKSKYYLSYDITHLLKAGLNDFCAAAHYLGGGGQNYVDGLPGFILQCHVEYENGDGEILTTDETWKAQENTPYENGTKFQQNRRISAIEAYDARKEEAGWLQCGFDDSHWSGACLSGINGRGWVLKPQIIPEGRVYETIVPAPVGIQEMGLQVFDAGGIISGWPELELPGIEGACVRMRYSEDLDEAGRVKHNVCNEKSENYYDQYTMRGEALETWEPRFSYKAFRYVEITGYPERIGPENIKIKSAGTGLVHSGYFNCSEKLLNDIYAACIQTQKNNVLGQMVDCPHREQAQYLADSDLQSETFAYNFFEPSVLKKVLLDFSDAQFDDGRFVFVFPTNVDSPDFNIKIPEWDLHFVSMLWKIYFIYDDADFLRTCYEPAKKTVDYYLGIRSEATGLVPRAEGFPIGWNISDWPYPDIDETGEYLTVQNCKLYNAVMLLSRMVRILGRGEEAAAYGRHGDILKESIVKQLYLRDQKRFADSYGSVQSHQGTNVVAYQYGLVPEADRKAVLEFIAGEGFGCSTLLSLNLLQVLFENGKGREAYNLLKRTQQPGWGHMIEKGYKTIWEGFQDRDSHSHAWNAYPARIFSEYLTGIKAAAPGFREIVIKPYIPEEMQFAESRVRTVMGEIYTRWDASGNGIRLEVGIPADAAAKVQLPLSAVGTGSVVISGETVWKNGSFYDNNIGVAFEGEEGQYIKFKINSRA